MADPLPLCHLNGTLLPLREARISPLDRAFLFGDSAYEVIPAWGGRAKRLRSHLARLARSLSAMGIRDPHDEVQWTRLIEALMAANGGGDLQVYLQVSRGAEWGRNHAPPSALEPTVFAFCQPLASPSAEVLEHGISCVTALDTRWARCDIKSTSLLANVLLRGQAAEAGASEIILLRDGLLTEASASSVYVVIDDCIWAPPNSPQLLPATTRGLLEELADAHGIARRAGNVTERELRGAAEVWLSAATRGVQAVTRLDGRPVAGGKPGPLWRRMHALMDAYWRE